MSENKCRGLSGYQDSIIQPGTCACLMPGNGTCLNPRLRGLLPETILDPKNSGSRTWKCPTNGARP